MAEQAPKKNEESAAEMPKEPKAVGVMTPSMGYGRTSNIFGAFPLIIATFRRAANYISLDNLTRSYARFKHYFERKRKENEDEQELKRLKDEKLKGMMAEGTPHDEAKGAANYLTRSYARFKHYIESKRKEREDEKELRRLKDEKLKTMMAEGTPNDDEAKGVGSGKKRGPSSSKK